MSEPYQIEATADGATASIHLPTGIFALEIKADTWDGASTTLQEGYGSVFTNSDDPYNTGNALTRTGVAPTAALAPRTGRRRPPDGSTVRYL